VEAEEGQAICFCEQHLEVAAEAVSISLLFDPDCRYIFVTSPQETTGDQRSFSMLSMEARGMMKEIWTMAETRSGTRHLCYPLPQ
jgi:hypothetical protein